MRSVSAASKLVELGMAAFSSDLPACSVARTVEPKRRKVSESEKNLRLAQKELARIKVL